MKTVMKKLLSLMLVAILLVSAVPFQASAAEGEGEAINVKVNTYLDGEFNNDKKVVTVDPGAIVELSAALATSMIKEGREFVKWTNPSGKNVTDGTISYDWLSKDEQADYYLNLYIETATEPETSEPETSEPETSEPETSEPETSEPETSEPETSEPETSEPETSEPETSEPAPSEDDEEEDEPQKKTVKFINELNDETVYIAEDDNGKITTPSQGDFVPGYSFKGWKAAGSSKLLGEGKTYKAKNLADVYYASYTQTYEEDDNTLNVYVRRYVGSTRKETVLIHTKTGLMSNDKVLEYLGTVKSDLINRIQDLFPGYYWSGNYYNYYGNEIATANNLTTDGAKNVYINIYTDETDVLVYIYKATTKSYDRLIEMSGYVEGETVTYNSVLSQVKKYYSGSNMSMTMYDADGWADYKDGKSNTSTHGVSVESDGTTKIYVYLKNASSSSSSKADSSNPKTGDTIFMAVTVMAVSASALALVYFFNKKRLAR